MTNLITKKEKEKGKKKLIKFVKQSELIEIFLVLKSTVFLIKPPNNKKRIFMLRRHMWVGLVREFSVENPPV